MPDPGACPRSAGMAQETRSTCWNALFTFLRAVTGDFRFMPRNRWEGPGIGPQSWEWVFSSLPVGSRSVTGTKPGSGPVKSSGWHGDYWVGQKVRPGFSIRCYRKKKTKNWAALDEFRALCSSWLAHSLQPNAKKPTSSPGEPKSSQVGFSGARRKVTALKSWLMNVTQRDPQLNGHEVEQAPGVGDGQGSLACCSPWGHKELDTTEWLKWTELNWPESQLSIC